VYLDPLRLKNNAGPAMFTKIIPILVFITIRDAGSIRFLNEREISSVISTITGIELAKTHHCAVLKVGESRRLSGNIDSVVTRYKYSEVKSTIGAKMITEKNMNRTNIS
jgi:hypothetical protein